MALGDGVGHQFGQSIHGDLKAIVEQLLNDFLESDRDDFYEDSSYGQPQYVSELKNAIQRYIKNEVDNIINDNKHEIMKYTRQYPKKNPEK